MGDETGMMMFMFMFVAIAGGLYMFRDKLGGLFGGGAPEEIPPMEEPPTEEMPIGGFTADMLDCAKRCDSCDDVIDPETGSVYWHAARTNDEKRCFSCLRDKCRFLFPEDPKTIIKKIYIQPKKPKERSPRNNNDPPKMPSYPQKASYAFRRYGY